MNSSARTTLIPASNTASTILRAEGFSCPSCVAKIEKQLGRLPGVSAVRVFFSSARIEIDHDPDAVGTDALLAAVRKAGYVAHLAAY